MLAWLVPHETAAISAQVLCTPYNHAPCHFMQSHIRKVYACLAVTCHLHFWQNDRGLLRATAVTRRWNGYRNKSQHRKLTLEKKILPPPQQGFEPATFDHKSGALTTELSPLPKISQPLCELYARVASAVVLFLFLFFLVAARGVCSRGERYRHFWVFSFSGRSEFIVLNGPQKFSIFKNSCFD